MSFILPEETVQTGVPTPTGDGVRLNHIPAARFAALRFEGSRSSETETKALETLRGWLADQKLASQGEPLFAYYDPPWTPVPMRRNEVFLRLKALPEKP
ncbi:MAG: heme-binding protein [Verrucomicrobiales bacterium]